MHFLSFSPGVDLREILGKEAFHAVEIEDINALMVRLGTQIALRAA